MKKEVNESSRMPTQGERNIWTFYEWAVIIAPVVVMFSHWGIFYVFSQNSNELMIYSEPNEICIAWMYSIMYLYVPLMILPASYFFRWCNLFRIPFVYFIFINVERWYYGSWFCTNEMIDTHFILIYCIIMLYVFELTEISLRHRKMICEFVKTTYSVFKRKLKKSFRCGMSDEECDEILKLLEEEKL
mgnify:CR=1 FL=1